MTGSKVKPPCQSFIAIQLEIVVKIEHFALQVLLK
jgi:hypothetical protein